MADPIREPDEFTGYLDATQRGELAVQACESCGASRWPPRPACPSCTSTAEMWRVISPPEGKLFTWTVVHHTPLERFKDKTPYVVGVVSIDVDDGGPVRMIGQVAVEDLESLQIDLALRARFDRDGDRVLVNWEPIAAEETR